MRSVPRILAVLTALLASACSSSDDGSREGFVTTRSLADAHAVALGFMQRNAYSIVDQADRLVRAEKRRPLASGGGEEIDLMTVRLSPDGAGTRVLLQGVTYLLEGGSQREAPQLSAAIQSDLDALARELGRP
jgi:hypothetical protein